MDQFAVEPNLYRIVAAETEDAPGLLGHLNFSPGVSNGIIARAGARFQIHYIALGLD